MCAKKKESEGCLVSICEDPKSGRIYMRPEGCNPDEVLKYVKKIKEDKGFDMEI